MARTFTRVAVFPAGDAGYPSDRVIDIVGQGTTQVVTASATAGTSAAFQTATQAIRIVGSTALWYKMDGTADTSGNATYLPGGAVEYVLVGSNAGTVSCIQDSSDLSGTSQSIVSITELPTDTPV